MRPFRPTLPPRPHPTARSLLGAGLAVALAVTLAAPARAGVPPVTNQATDAAPAASPTDTQYVQYTGERILGLPKKPTCTVVMTKDYPMANTAYGPDKPYQGKFKPGDCTGPWTRIVAHVHTKVTGVQFDRIGWVDLGGARIVTLSSQEPRGEGGGWVVQDETYDVTRYASLFTKGSPVEFNIANVVTGPYTGIFYSDLSFEFYDDSAVPPLDAVPDQVTGLPASTILADPVTQEFTVPANTIQLAAELYVKGSGGCDEFWWAAAPNPWPGQCDSYPIREIDVSIDGQPAALVNTYPALFTGANGPSWWHPIPAPRAYDLRPYTVDLGPFIGTLTDGARHEITYTIPERRWTDGNDVTVWSNLLVTRNADSEGRTTGQITQITAPDVSIRDQGTGTSYEMWWTHGLSVRGSTQAAGGSPLARDNYFSATAHTYGGATNDDRYRWGTSSQRGPSEDWLRYDQGHYRLVSQADGWFLQDNGHTNYIEDGTLVNQVRLRDKMHSNVKAGTPTNRHSSEKWSYTTDSPLGCGTTRLVGENPNIVKNKTTSKCRWGK